MGRRAVLELKKFSSRLKTDGKEGKVVVGGDEIAAGFLLVTIFLIFFMGTQSVQNLFPITRVVVGG